MIKGSGGLGVRTRGFNYERQLVREFKKLGWLNAITARAESRNKDSLKCDILNINPFNVQAKCKNNFGNPLPTLLEMPEDENYNIVFSKVVSKGEFIIMSKNDFYEIIQMLKVNQII